MIDSGGKRMGDGEEAGLKGAGWRGGSEIKLDIGRSNELISIYAAVSYRRAVTACVSKNHFHKIEATFLKKKKKNFYKFTVAVVSIEWCESH